MSGALWFILLILCVIRFGFFLNLPARCKRFIVETKAIFFLSVVSSGYFALFMVLILFTSISDWMSSHRRNLWLMLMVLMMTTHLTLLVLFYILGWNFMLHLVSQTIALWDRRGSELFRESNGYCQTRFVFFGFLFSLFAIYLVLGLSEFYFLIKWQRNDTESGKRETVDVNPLKYESGSKFKYDSVGAPPSNSEKDGGDHGQRAYLRSCRLRKLFMILFYFTAIVHVIIHDIINQSTESDITVREECDELDFSVSTFYSEDFENLFVFIMLMDLVLFGELFKSYKIMLDPFYWFAKLVWRTTESLSLGITALTVTSSIFAALAFLFVKYDIGL